MIGTGAHQSARRNGQTGPAYSVLLLLRPHWDALTLPTLEAQRENIPIHTTEPNLDRDPFPLPAPHRLTSPSRTAELQLRRREEPLIKPKQRCPLGTTTVPLFTPTSTQSSSPANISRLDLPHKAGQICDVNQIDCVSSLGAWGTKHPYIVQHSISNCLISMNRMELLGEISTPSTIMVWGLSQAQA